MTYKWCVGIAALILVTVGTVRRSWTKDWYNGPEVMRVAARMEQLPLTIGRWRGQSLELDAKDVASAGYAAGMWRRYEQSGGGHVVSLLMVCGRPGPVSVHTPEACYGGAGFTQVAKPVRMAPAGNTEEATFWQADFVRPGELGGKRLRIYWAWNAGNGWQATDNPRLAHVSNPVLTKVYVVCEMTSLNETQTVAACQDFIRVMLPELQRIISRPS